MTHLANRNQHVPGTTLFFVRVVAVSLGLCCLLAACGGGSDKSKAGSSYPDSAEGLSQLIGDIIKYAEDRDTMERADQLAHRLQLDDHRAWFIEHFGSDLGTTLAADYTKVAESIGQIAGALKKLAADGFTNVKVERFDKPDDPGSLVYQHMALQRMKKRTSLYSVRVLKKDGSRGFHLWSFVYERGGFRWVGKMTGVASGPDMDGKHDRNELRLRERKQIDSD